MFLTKILPENNLSLGWKEKRKKSFWKEIILSIWAFVLSTNLVLAEPNKTIGIVNFLEWWTAELYKDKNWKFEVRNWNSKKWTDHIYGTTIINGKKYIVCSMWIWYDIEVFLEKDIIIYKEYLVKYGKNRAYKLVKSREQYLENFFKDNPLSDSLNEIDREKRALDWWEVVINKINNK